MKKYLIFLIPILLISCGERNLITKNGKPTGLVDRTYYVVDRIENKSNGLCKYYISTDTWRDYKWEIEFVDSINKYQLNQHLYATFELVK